MTATVNTDTAIEAIHAWREKAGTALLSGPISDTYKPLLKGWLPKHMGTMPTQAELYTAQMLAKRSPGKWCIALAMALRPEGVTTRQMALATGDQGGKHNVRNALGRAGYLKLNQTKAGSTHFVYYAVLTAKGAAACERHAAALAGTAKPKKAISKPRKPVVSVPAVTAAPVDAATAH